MGETRVYDMIVVGGGPGGYTAALYAARAGLDTLVLEKLSAGGQMALTEEIDNYPGYEDGIDGFTLAEKMQRQAERFGAQTAYAQVERMELTAAPKALKTSEGTFYARTVILATGANPRELGLAGEEALVGRGVAYCAACDGMRYKGKTVAVVGGGNSAAGDALLLSRIAERVVLVHRRDQLRATKIYHEPLIQAQHCYGAAARREADRHPAAGCADRGGIRPSLRRALHQRRQKAGHGAGERPAGAGCRRLCDGGRNHKDQSHRRLCRGRCTDEAAAPGSDGRGRWGHGGPHGGRISGRRRLIEEMWQRTAEVLPHICPSRSKCRHPGCRRPEKNTAARSI